MQTNLSNKSNKHSSVQFPNIHKVTDSTTVTSHAPSANMTLRPVETVLPSPLTVVGLVSMIKLRDEVSSEVGSPLIPAEKEETDDDKNSYTVCNLRS